MRRISAGDKGLQEQLNMALAEAESRLHQLEDGPFAGGRTLESVKLVAGATVAVPHGLGRSFRGWWIVRARPSAAMTTWLVVEDNNPRPTEQLVLRSGGDADVVVDVYVY